LNRKHEVCNIRVVVTPCLTYRTVDRNAAVNFSAQLRVARENAIRDAEAFQEIIHVVERLGSFLYPKGQSLGNFEGVIKETAINSILAEQIPDNGAEFTPLSLCSISLSEKREMMPSIKERLLVGSRRTRLNFL
jgi:hypothetical protein